MQVIDILHASRAHWRWIMSKNVYNLNKYKNKSYQMNDTAKDSDLGSRKRVAQKRLDFGFLILDQGVILVGTTYRILAINEAFTTITGFNEHDCIDRTCDFLLGPNPNHETQDEIRKSCQNHTKFSKEIESYRKDGTSFWNELSIKPIFNKAGKIKFFVWIINDISKHKAIELNLHELAFTDPLTKLPTRRVLEDRLGQVALKTSRSRNYAALFSIDLDHFKRINDQFGHSIGDLRLVDVANRLEDCVRGEDTVARFGGDEFFILVNELSPDFNIAKMAVSEIAQRIVGRLSTKSCLIGRQRKPCQLDDISQCQCSASIGAVLFSGKDRSIEKLLDEADHAMYQAKNTGGNAYQIYKAEIVSHDQSTDTNLLDPNKKIAKRNQVRVRSIPGEYL